MLTVARRGNFPAKFRFSIGSPGPSRSCAGQLPGTRWGFNMKTLAERFWPKVEMCGPNECWKWKAGFRNKRYGSIAINRIPYCAHRVSFELTNGPIPIGMKVLHRCDNPSCVNPAHLFLGTQRDNIKDRDSKNRQSRGEMQGQSKLTNSDVREIRNMRKDFNYSFMKLADMFGVSDHTICEICNKKAWKHVK